jgi:hypothetical protein
MAFFDSRLLYHWQRKKEKAQVAGHPGGIGERRNLI